MKKTTELPTLSPPSAQELAALFGRTAQKDFGRTPLFIYEVENVLKNVVFRDLEIALHSNIQTYGSAETVKWHHRPILKPGGMVYLRRKVVYREYDRKFPKEPYLTPKDFHFPQVEWSAASLQEETSFDFSYKTKDKYDRTRVGDFNSSFYVPELYSEEEVLEWIFYEIRGMEIHEMQENFYYRGERIFDPHVVGEKT